MAQDIEKQKDSGKVQILIVDDHEVVRRGLCQLITEQGGMEVCGEAENALAAINLLANVKADLVILDISMRGMNGIQLTEKLKVLYPDLPVVVLSICDDVTYVKRAFRAGASGYVSKQEVSGAIIDAIRDVLNGRMHVSRAMAEKIIEAKTSQY
jgi:DNA-binding NarL/FixJ family response regulator